MRRILCWLTAGMTAFAVTACHHSEQVNKEGASAESTSFSDETTLVSNMNPGQNSWNTGSTSRRTNNNRTAEPAEPAPPRLVIVPASTPLVMSLTEEISTSKNQDGDPFRGTLDKAVVINGETVLPAGTSVSGTVTRVYTPKAGKAHMWLELTQAELPSGSVYNLHTNTMELVANPSTEHDLEKVAAGGVAGGILGGIIGGGKGALIGAAVGAGAGTAVAVATRDKNVRLESGQKLQFVLTESMRVPPVA
ncbi:MAG TPA: hypothetical protein VE910_00755 [Dongiaceae bacterium]|jgi:hypothetical protein|nr:hypothetical protein [Dongiaceae bacterium]